MKTVDIVMMETDKYHWYLKHCKLDCIACNEKIYTFCFIRDEIRPLMKRYNKRYEIIVNRIYRDIYGKNLN